jgi:hypothetical protein
MKITMNKTSSEYSNPFKTGDWFLIERSICVLVQVDYSIVTLISVSKDDANRRNAIKLKVGNIRCISKAEMDELSNYIEYKRIECELIVTYYP